MRLEKRGQSVQSGSEQDDEEDNVDVDESADTPFSHARPSKTTIEEEDESEGAASDDDEAFIIEDDNAVELPVEFSMSTHQDLKYHFKIICQLFVHLAVQDPDDRRVFMEDSMKCEFRMY